MFGDAGTVTGSKFHAEGARLPVDYGRCGWRARLSDLSRVTVRPGEGDVEQNLAELAQAVLDLHPWQWPSAGKRPLP